MSMGTRCRPVCSVVAVVLSALSVQAQAPWVVSTDLGAENQDHGLVQVLARDPLGWSKVVTLGQETARSLEPENPSGRRAEGLFFDVEPHFADAARGKTVWLLVEVYSPNPALIHVNYERLGDSPSDRRAEAAKTLSSVPRSVQADKNRWGFLLFRCENVRFENGLLGAADFQVSVPDGLTVLNRVAATRVGPEFSEPDTGGMSIAFYPQNYGRIQGPTLSLLNPPEALREAFGQVQNAAGTGEVGGALVRLWKAGGKSHLYETFTRADGVYEFPMVEAGRYELRVSASQTDTDLSVTQVEVAGNKPRSDLGSVRISVLGHPYVSRYRSRLDRTLQTYALYLPSDYDLSPGKKYPLIMALHEMGQAPLQCLQAMIRFPDIPAILAAPGGRNDSNYEGIGEADVLETLDLISKDFRVDTKRIHLTGVGMGGSGSLKIAARYPDRFSSVSAIAAFTDLLALQDPETIPAFEEKSLRIRSPRFQIPNLRGLSVRLYQPSGDTLLVEQGRAFKNEMAQNGQSVLLREIDSQGWNLTQEVYGDRNFYESVCRDERALHPPHLAYQAESLTPGGAYWVGISEKEREERTSKIEAKVVDSQSIWIESANVAGLRVNPFIQGLEPNKQIKVWWNGRVEWTGIPEPSRKILLQSRKSASRFAKTPFQSGPAAEVFLEPFLYVMGDKLRFSAEEKAYLEWIESREWAGHGGTVVGAQQISSTDLKTKNLVLFGLPNQNSLVRTLVDDLPLTLGPNSLSFQGTQYAGEDLGFATVFPNPLSEDRLILWVAGFGSAGIRNLARTAFRWPDFVVVNDHSAETGQAKDVVAAGFYDQWWRFDPSQVYPTPGNNEAKVGKTTEAR